MDKRPERSLRDIVDEGSETLSEGLPRETYSEEEITIRFCLRFLEAEYDRFDPKGDNPSSELKGYLRATHDLKWLLENWSKTEIDLTELNKEKLEKNNGN
jgi:hypothetical protein